MKTDRRAVVAGLLVALTVSLGNLLAAVPNVELITASLFLSGYLLGVRLGLVVAVCSGLVYGLLNPMGPSLPPLLGAQLVGFTVAATAGALLGPALVDWKGRVGSVLAAGMCGLFITLLYDTLTNAASYYLLLGGDSSLALGPFLLGGGIFMALHTVWNAVLFATALPPALRVLRRHRRELLEVGS